MSWAAEEFRGIDLGDKRLDARAVLLAERLADKPTASLPGACRGWGETQAAYRFLAQEKLDWLDLCERRSETGANWAVSNWGEEKGVAQGKLAAPGRGQDST
jgi:hypothetical protein